MSRTSGLTFSTELGPGDALAAAELVAGAYWNDEVDLACIARAHEGSTAWVGAHDAGGSLVATARAISDGAKHAWIYDVMVAPSLRGQRVGDELVRRLLDHPKVAEARYVHLGTRDAQGFYRRMGFVDRAEIPRPYASTTMTLVRPDRGAREERGAEGARDEAPPPLSSP